MKQALLSMHIFFNFVAVFNRSSKFIQSSKRYCMISMPDDSVSSTAFKSSLALSDVGVIAYIPD